MEGNVVFTYHQLSPIAALIAGLVILILPAPPQLRDRGVPDHRWPHRPVGQIADSGGEHMNPSATGTNSGLVHQRIVQGC